uniref:Uncharacterized protein n=1 Tax=Setaria italica TaxID=4555 RepID=K4AJ36_SETIT
MLLWWEDRARTTGISHKGLHSLIILVCWEVWLECNSRIF